MDALAHDFTTLTDPAALDTPLLAQLSRMRDPVGFLSVSLTITPGAHQGESAPWAIDLRNRMAELHANLKDAGERDAWRALDDLGGRAAAALNDITSHAAPGIGRIAYIPLSGGDPITISLQVPVPARVVLERDPFLRPLLTALSRSRPVGVVVAGGDGMQAWKWSAGIFTPLLDEGFDQHQAPRGGVRGSGARAARSSTAPESIARRQENAWERFASEVAERFADDEHRFDRILLFADDRSGAAIAPVLAERFSVDRTAVNLAAKDLPTALMAPVTERCALLRADDERSEASAIREAVASGGAGAIGLAGVVSALNDKQVEMLVLDASHRWSGRLLDDGRFDLGGDSAEHDTRLGERMIEAALEQGALISIHEDAAATLGDEEAVGALLRW